MSYWQIAAGDAGRDYADVFLRHGIAFVGGDGPTEAMKSVALGDCMILKRGMRQIVAVGTVVERDGRFKGVGDKAWLRDFDGWDLPAYCYVDWRVPENPMDVSGLTRGTLLGLNQEHLRVVAGQLLELPPQDSFTPEPEDTDPVDDATILDFLIKEGLRPSAAEDLTNAFRRIRLLASYYYRHTSWEDVREHETRAFLVMPLLLALGWAEQQIKIELPCPGVGKIDVACFSRPYRRGAESGWQPNDADCALIIETKGFTQGLSYAPEQAHAYAQKFPSCRVAVVTNGYCYKTFARAADGSFVLRPTAYLNILNPRKRYPLDPRNVDGALEVLRHLLPVSSR
jgi:hypothetical protein